MKKLNQEQILNCKTRQINKKETDSVNDSVSSITKQIIKKSETNVKKNDQINKLHPITSIAIRLLTGLDKYNKNLTRFKGKNL
jgi:GTP1/Obg family GTP-binding protein